MLERNAAEGIFLTFRPKVRSYVRSRVRNRADAEDLESEVFFKVVSHWEDYDPDRAGYSTWIYAITRNTVNDYYRRKAPLPLNEEAATLAAPPPEEEAMRAEALDYLAEELARLSERERDVLILRFYRGMSGEEIGKALKLTCGNVRVIQARALRKLRNRMEGKR